MNTTPSPGTIEELAKRAIETRKAFIETDLPEGSIGHSMLFADGVATNTAYHSAATPEAWLTLSARVRELEGRDALRDRTALEMEARMVELEASERSAFQRGYEMAREDAANKVEFYEPKRKALANSIRALPVPGNDSDKIA